MQEATPRPWRISHTDKKVIEGQSTGKPYFSVVAETCGYLRPREANAELIVTAVNEHDARVRVCEAAEALLQENPYNQSDAVRDELHAALAALKGGA